MGPRYDSEEHGGRLNFIIEIVGGGASKKRHPYKKGGSSTYRLHELEEALKVLLRLQKNIHISETGFNRISKGKGGGRIMPIGLRKIFSIMVM